ncbi:MAG: Crp/Fnr family transcriptional regulator [Chloroflexota bacterium]
MNPIQDLQLFDGLDADVIEAIQSIAEQIVLAKGEKLYEQGDTATAFYVVLRGGVRMVEHTYDGKSLNLKVYGPGDSFGLLAIAGGYSHAAEMVAMHPTVVLGFEGSIVRRLIADYPSVGLRIIDALVDHVHHAHDRIRHMALEKTERRLARALLHFCTKFGQQNGNEQIRANFTQKDIAEFTSTTVETVSRFFKTWEKQGYIKRDRMSITVLSVEGLRRIIDEDGERGMGYHLM